MHVVPASIALELKCERGEEALGHGVVPAVAFAAHAARDAVAVETREGVTVTSDNPDLGEVREELEAEYNGEPIAIGFNPKYVVELLTQMSSDQVTVALGGELDPGLIRPLTGDDYLGVVMPMRI
ncbi:MAG TPA: hypothetical protein VIX73_38150 [Kofleriaceae bacterium]